MTARILVVEDDAVKLRSIVQFLKAVVADATIFETESLYAGLKVAEQERIDVVILDMTLPNYSQSAAESGGSIYDLGGLEFVNQLYEEDLVVPVIVVTQYERFGDEELRREDIDAMLRKSYGKNYLGFVFYQSSVTGWQEQLAALLVGVPAISLRARGRSGG
jgi:CheY-like chemotaxis protein